MTAEHGLVLRAIRGRLQKNSGNTGNENTRTFLDGLMVFAERRIAEREAPGRLLRDELDRIDEELARPTNTAVFAGRLARSRVNRQIEARRAELRREVVGRFETIFATPINAEHAARVAARCEVEYQRVEKVVSDMRRVRAELERVAADDIERERSGEIEARHRDLTARRHAIRRQLPEAGWA